MQHPDAIIARYWQKRIERRVADKQLFNHDRRALDTIDRLELLRQRRDLDLEIATLEWVLGEDAERQLDAWLTRLEAPVMLRQPITLTVMSGHPSGDDAA